MKLLPSILRARLVGAARKPQVPSIGNAPTQQINRLVALGFFILISILLLVSWLSYDRLIVVDQTLHHVVNNHNRKVLLANRMLDAVQERRYSLHALVMQTDPVESELEWERFTLAASDYLNARKEFHALKLNDQERSLLLELDQLTTTGQRYQFEVVELKRLGNQVDALNWLAQAAQPAQQKAIDKMEEILHLQNQSSQQAIAQAELTYDRGLYALTALDGAAVILAVVLAVLITRRVHAQALEVEAQRHRYHALFDASMDAMLIWGYGKFIGANKAALQMFGLANANHLMKFKFEQLFPDTQAEAQEAPVLVQWLTEQARNHGFKSVEVQMRRTNQQVFPAHIELTHIDLSTGPIIQILVRDLSETRNAQLRLEQLAHYDSVTQLPNAAHFREELQTLLNHARQTHRKVVIIHIDLQRFTLINDSLGRIAGDLLLRQVAQRLTSAITERDRMARLGGDDFLIACAGLSSAEEAARIAQRLLQQFQKGFLVSEHRTNLSAQIGMSLYPDDGYQVTDLLSRAELALHRAGSQENSYQFYNEMMHAEAYRRLVLEEELQHGLEHGEFVLHYQPRMSLPSRKVSGVEALLRWMHPQRGLLLPEHFITVAEDSGLLMRLGEWICRTACQHAQVWREQGWPELQLTINLSPRQFLDTHLTTCLESTLRQTGLPPEALELDLSERITLHDEAQVLARLRALKNLGVKLALDDFGAGYSALSYLKRRFPLDTVKIDRSFMREIPQSSVSQTLATAMIQLSHSLNTKVLAEGVETEAQLEFLQTHLCDDIQGYYLGAALPFEGMSSFLQARRSPPAAPDAPVVSAEAAPPAA